MKNYDVTVDRQGKWWMVTIAGVESVADFDPVGRARSIRGAQAVARSRLASHLGIAADTVPIRVTAKRIGAVDDVSKVVERIQKARAQAEKLDRSVAEQSLALAKSLAEQGISLRDIGAIMGLSHQRVDQLIRA